MKLINKIISSIKKQDYMIDNKIPISSFICILFKRLIFLIRGIFKGLFLGKRGKILFIGRRVNLIHKKYIKFGSGITIGDYVEIDSLSELGVTIGDNVNIGNYTIIRCTGTLKKLGIGIKIGNNCGTGDFCFFGAAGGIKIGDNVIMGQNVRFHSENHKFDRVDIPIRNQGVTNKGIVIGNDCWIGSGSVFLDGVNVGNGCVIGANTLVNKDIPDFSIAVGNPVKIIKNRMEKL